MKDQIIIYLNDPRQLEKLYRTNKGSFKQAFNTLYPEFKGNTVADLWNERLSYEPDELNWGTSRELVVIILVSLASGVIAKLPSFLGINQEFFYSRNVGFIVFPLLSVYFIWKNKLLTRTISVIVGLTLVSLLYINLLPDKKGSDTLTLSCIYIVLFLWSVLGFAFVGEPGNNEEKRLSYLRYNGELLVMTTLILIAGSIMTGITIGLFELIGLHIEDFYFSNVVVFGLSSAPIVGTYLTQTNPQLVEKVSPILAKLFSPLILFTLVIYLTAIIYSGKDPYNDRGFLLTFNILLIGVMAIIFFSVAETSRAAKSLVQVWVLFLLSTVTIVVNGIALSAILFRISEWGITPNRASVLGSNVLILTNLLLVTAQLFRVLSKGGDLTRVSKSIVSYLPVYTLWAVIVTFLFPLLFGFR